MSDDRSTNVGVAFGSPGIIHVIRTNKIPFIQSRASWPLTATTLSIMAFGMWLPYSPLAPSLGLVQLPRLYWPILMLTLLSYVSHSPVSLAFGQ
jgi:hypothetical protein